MKSVISKTQIESKKIEKTPHGFFGKEKGQKFLLYFKNLLGYTIIELLKISFIAKLDD